MVGVNNGSTWSATYDAFGRRVERVSTGGGRSEELYDPSGQLLGHLNGANGVWWEEYVPFDGRLLWYYTQATNVSRYFHVNALGSLGLATDQTGAPVEEMLYYPFGVRWQNSTGFGWDEKFAQFPQRDEDIQMYEARHREYNPGLGRWMTPDPMGMAATNPANPQSWNRYAYVLNNPTTYTDPLGLFRAGIISGLDSGCTEDPASGELNCGLRQPWLFMSAMGNWACTNWDLNCGNTPSLQASGGGLLVAQSPISVRKKGQSFTQCMKQNSKKFSIGGAGQAFINKMTGAKISLASKPFVNIFAGNGVASLIFGTPDDQATSAAVLTPHTVAKAMGTPVTSGSGAAADILEPLANGGATQALSSATESIKSFLGALDTGLSLGLEFGTRVEIDTFFTAAEAYGCTEHSPSSMEMVF